MIKPLVPLLFVIMNIRICDVSNNKYSFSYQLYSFLFFCLKIVTAFEEINSVANFGSYMAK